MQLSSWSNIPHPDKSLVRQFTQHCIRKNQPLTMKSTSITLLTAICFGLSAFAKPTENIVEFNALGKTAQYGIHHALRLANTVSRGQPSQPTGEMRDVQRL
jgi:hypothetical protein